MIYEQTWTIDSRDADLWGQCRPSALLGYLQEAATGASAEIGADRRTMVEDYRCFWMLARIWVELDRPLRWGESLTVRTWHRPPKGASIYRDFDLFCGEEQVGQAVSTWALADVDSRKLARMERVAGLLEGNRNEKGEKTITLSRLRLPEEMTFAEERLARYSETDLNGHVNNTRYADYACDALHVEELEPGHFLHRIQIGFLAECRPGERLSLFCGEREGTRFVRGLGPEGGPRFEAALELVKG